MVYALIGLLVLGLVGFAVYALISRSEVASELAALQEEIQEQDAEYTAEIDTLNGSMAIKISALHEDLREQGDRLSREKLDLEKNLINLQHLKEIESLEEIERHGRETEALKAKMVDLERFRHIPDVLEKSRKLEAEIAAKLAEAQSQADQTVLIAHKDAERIKARIAAKLETAERQASELVAGASTRATVIVERATLDANDIVKRAHESVESDTAKASELLSDADHRARICVAQARQLAREIGAQAEEHARAIASQARKEAKEKTLKVDETLAAASKYAIEVRQKAESRGREIAGQAYEALKRYEFYEQAARAKQNVIEGYADTYIVPASHVLDELADEFAFQKSGERLKIARDRTRVMEKNGLAATCNYAEGWKRDYAISFVLSAFNGKVDSILARLKPANQGKLVQEIKDVYALANHNGDVFKNARIHEEYLESRLEELKWAVAVQRVKEKLRDEQRAIREQMRDEEKAKKEYERAIKQAEREEQALAKRLELERRENAAANAQAEQARLRFEAEQRVIEEKLRRIELEAERESLAEELRNILAEKEKQSDEARKRQLEYEARFTEVSTRLGEYDNKKRALSLAQQTRVGYVYVISNVGSFGEDVFKIGLTRRINPQERVDELGDASVPFAFDVHAMIRSEDAPALEADLHRRFLQNQVNKVNRRKEFFRLKLQDIRGVIDELAPQVKWTMAAAARDYRESLAMERQLQEDPDFRRQWAESEAAHEARHMFDSDEADEEGDVAIAEEAV